MRIVIDKDLNLNLHLGTDVKLKEQGLSTLSFGETEKLKQIKEALKKNPNDEKLQNDMKFANLENQKIRYAIKDELKKADVEFNYGKIEGTFQNQKWVPLKEGEKFEKGAYVIDAANIDKLATALKEKGKNIAVSTSYLGKMKKFENDPLYMAEVKRIRTSALYAEGTGIKYDKDAKVYRMPAESLKKGFDLEKKDDSIVKTAFNHNLDSVKSVYAVAGLDENGQLKGLKNEKDIKNTVGIKKETDNAVFVETGYFNPHRWSKETLEKDAEKKSMLNAINLDRYKTLKETLGATWNKEEKSWVIAKENNPGWKEKLNDFIKADADFCNQKAEELEVLNDVKDITKERDSYTKSFGSNNDAKSPSPSM
jgi:hypothetical protein